MKLFTNDNIRAIERYSIEHDGVTEYDLVDRVAEGVVSEINSRWRPNKHTVIFAGPGNNGADALAVARRLAETGFKPSVYLFNIGGNKLSATCRRYRDELLSSWSSIAFSEVVSRFTIPEINSSTLVIDGLFGSGLRDQLTGGFMALVRYINESNASVVSIDVPSGLFADWNGNSLSRNIVHADLTLCVQFPRISFFLSDNAEIVGEWKILDIGLSREAIASTPTNFHLVEEVEVKRLLRRRTEFCSKADFGSCRIIAGRYGMAGASVLACRGAIRSGVGKVTLHAPQCAFEVIQSSVPEALFEADRDKIMLTDAHTSHRYDAEGIGPGLGTDDMTVNAVESYLKNIAQRPVVIDADAINCMAIRPSMLNHVPQLSVLTPHAGEFDRLFGEQSTAESRLIKAIDVSAYHNILILLKGRYTALVRPDGKVYFNSSGSPALATAGSGDVLTGVITSLMAQKYKPEVSALLGAYIHGVAGELAAEDHGQYGVTASDVALCIGKAIKRIMMV